MGGGGQANSGQATQAANQQTAASQQEMQLAQKNSALQDRMVGMLFGNGTPGSTGTLSGMLDPKSLNQKGLNDNYQTQFNEGSNQLGKDYANQRGSLAQSFANSGATGSSTPSGFQADQMNKLSRSNADSRGALYSGLKGAQYSDALNNFWNASNIASGNAATGVGAATKALGDAGGSSASIYGTAGAYHPSQWGSVVGGALDAGGKVGAAAMCPVDGSLILMADNSLKKIEEIQIGDRVLGMDRRGDEVIDIRPTMQKVCTVFTLTKYVTVSLSHTFDRHYGGYSFALNTLAEYLEIEGGPQVVLEVRSVGEEKMCRHLMLKRSHGYCCDGFWSLE